MLTRRRTHVLWRLPWMAVVLLTTAAAAQSPATPSTTTVREAIDRGYADYVKAFAEADAAALAAVYDAQGARLNSNGVVVQGRAAIIEDVSRFLGRVGPVEVIIEIVDLWVIDDLVYETGTWSYRFTPSGQDQQTVGGRYVTVWKRQPGGAWKILADLGVPGT